jgi:long-chain fatty acid transport protein
MQIPHGRLLRALLALPLLTTPASVRASGFALDAQGARATGLCGAFVAQAADASAVYYNPAGLAFLKGRRFYGGGLFDEVSMQFTGSGPNPAAGTVESASGGLGLLPTLYASQPVGTRTVVGLGIYQPFGFRNEWQSPDAFSGRFVCVDCRARAWSINPTLSYKLADRLAIGGGIDVRLSRFDQKRRLLASPNPFPTATDVAELSVESQTTRGVGWNVGVLASPSDTVSVGLAYRHKVRLEHQATASFAQIPTGDVDVDAAVASALPKPQLATVAFTYPASLTGGVAVRRGELTLEADLGWTFWSSFDAVSLTFPELSAYDELLPQDYGNAWRLAIGAEYAIGAQWEVRGGYGYDRSPQPALTLSPFLPEASRHALALGGSYKYGEIRVDAVGRLLLYGDRATDGVSHYEYEGLYHSRGFSFGVSVGYRF